MRLHIMNNADDRETDGHHGTSAPMEELSLQEAMPEASERNSDGVTRSEPDYVTFARRFPSYRWFKPILVLLLTSILSISLLVWLPVVWTAAGLDIFAINPELVSLDRFGIFEPTTQNIIGFFLPAFVNLVALFLAIAVVGERPLSSYSSSRGGWSWKAFFESLAIALPVMVLGTIGGDVIVAMATEPGLTLTEVVASWFEVPQMTIWAVVAVLVLLPLQCANEEYLYRGAVMQAVGGWVGIPILAILVQAMLFGIGHAQYNLVGMISIMAIGLLLGFTAWRTRGLEASTAMHVANNMLALWGTSLAVNAGASADLTNDMSVLEAIMGPAFVALAMVCILVVGHRFGWFLSHDVTEDVPAATSEANPKSRLTGRRKATMVVATVIVIATAICKAYTASQGCIQMQSEGMEPVLYPGDVVSTEEGSFDIGDIVMFMHEDDENPHLIIQRVVAMDASVAEIRNGVLYVNNEKAPWQDEEHGKLNRFDQKWEIHDGEILLLPDNWDGLKGVINESKDKDIASIVSQDDIVARVTGIVFPPAHISQNLG